MLLFGTDPLTEPWMAQLMNFGGVGILAIVLFWLHRDALAWFREELRKERESRETAMTAERADHDKALKDERDKSQEMWKFYMDLKVRQHEIVMAAGAKQHEAVMTALVAQDKVLTELKNRREDES